MSEDDFIFLKQAIEKARDGVAQGGFPAGAVVVKDGKVIGEGISIGNVLHDPTSHGDLSAIREACKNQTTSSLSGATLYASMEPCSMCLSAAMWAAIPRIVFACPKTKVSAEYYGGHYASDDLNKTFIKPRDIYHLSELEQESLALVKQWENSFN